MKLSKPITDETLSRVAARFWRNVDRREPDECWPWKGSISCKGYGRLKIDGGYFQAHRVALHLDGRPLKAAEQACHHCDNPRCVNPSHLFRGTNRDNAIDRMNKGRGAPPFGEIHTRAKLTEADVTTIRTSQEPNARLAEAFGVAPSTINAARTGRTWRHIQ